jgi:hypothetical protein
MAMRIHGPKRYQPLHCFLPALYIPDSTRLLYRATLGRDCCCLQTRDYCLTPVYVKAVWMVHHMLATKLPGNDHQLSFD